MTIFFLDTMHIFDCKGIASTIAGSLVTALTRDRRLGSNQQQRLEKQLEQAHRENALLAHKIAIQDVLGSLKLQPGCDRAKKK